ncbi:MAG: Nif3-like dinuclear metal center hexameric protein [Flavobacteriales bacterium]|nr:Nif3-like dinuclear metal center hexameric protein [Flavobacteriales bacterium]
MKLQDLLKWVQEFAPVEYHEEYDNVGLLVKGEEFLTGILVSLDCTEEVIEEAIQKKCNAVIAHHPILFKGIKRIIGANYIERALLKAIRNNISIIALHTNLDNVHYGVNAELCRRLNIQNPQILQPKTKLLCKLYTYVPASHHEHVSNALFAAGAGNIGNYSECSFTTEGLGTFKANDQANPFVGQIGKRHTEPERKLEVVFPAYLQTEILQALRNSHPYEEIAYEVIELQNSYQMVGSGMIGNLPEPKEVMDLLQNVKNSLSIPMLRYTAPIKHKVQRVAVCGGAGFFLLKDAIKAGADVFITADIKYHDFFEADGKILLVDAGHFETEQFTKDLLAHEIQKKFPTFAVLISNTNTNPVNYL